MICRPLRNSRQGSNFLRGMVWYLAAQRVGGYGPDRPSPVSGRLGLSAGGGVWSRGGLRERTIPYPAKSPNPGCNDSRQKDYNARARSSGSTRGCCSRCSSPLASREVREWTAAPAAASRPTAARQHSGLRLPQFTFPRAELRRLFVLAPHGGSDVRAACTTSCAPPAGAEAGRRQTQLCGSNEGRKGRPHGRT